jgi:PHD/YefM family antitoxin component YafN of YafNO toxin-antitoxin module
MSENEEEFTELIKKTRSDDVPVVIVDKNILAPNVSFKSISELVNLIVDLRNS